jgi:transcriptional regulator with XRE-family HTH domain
LYNTFKINTEVWMDRIRQLRKERGLSQVKLAVMADMDPATLNRLEQGKGNPNLKTLERVATALDVEVADLLGKAPASSQPSFNGLLEEEQHSSKTVTGEAHLSSTGKLTATGKIMQAVDEYHEGEISREELEERIEELVPA